MAAALTLARRPPKKQPGQGRGPRTINGAAMDVRSGADYIGVREKALRAMVARGLIPYRRWSGRIIFLRRELEAFLEQLPGVSLDVAARNREVRRCD